MIGRNLNSYLISRRKVELSEGNEKYQKHIESNFEEKRLLGGYA